MDKKFIQPNVVLTVDAIVEKDHRVLWIRRKYPPYGLALPGGKVEDNETVEEAVKRELFEEASIEATKMELFGVYSKPDRDPRFRAVSVVFKIVSFNGIPKAADDAEDFCWLPIGETKKDLLGAFKEARVIWNNLFEKYPDYDADPDYPFAFDHGDIMADYISKKFFNSNE